MLLAHFIQVLALWCAFGFCLIKLCLFFVYHLFFNSPLKYFFYWDVGHSSGLMGMENVCFGWLGRAVGGAEGQSTFGRTWDDYNAKHSSITLSLLFFLTSQAFCKPFDPSSLLFFPPLLRYNATHFLTPSSFHSLRLDLCLNPSLTRD